MPVRPLVRPMTRIRTPLLATALVLATLVAGCTSNCAPVDVPTQVSLGLQSEEARTLPILVSGATRIAGEELPDSHGRLEFVVDVSHHGNTNASLNFSDIDIANLHLKVVVDGATLPVEILKVEGARGWTRIGPNAWNGGAVSSTRIVVWWAVDSDPVRNPLAIVLPEGEAYTATLDFDWTHQDCYARASGHAETSIEDFVQASVNARTFVPASPPQIEVKSSGVGLRSDFTIRSGLNVTVRSVEMKAVRLGPPVVAANATVNATANGSVDPTAVTTAIGGGASLDVAASTGTSLVLFPRAAWLVDGNETSRVSPGKTLRVQSAAATSALYAASGTMLPTPFQDGPGLYIVHVSITYLPDDPTLGLTTDTFAQVVVRT